MIKIFFIVCLLMFVVSCAENPKVCESDDDRISGCVSKVYDEDGTLMGEMPYQNGKLNGLVKAYGANGELLSEMPFKDDLVNGIARLYNENQVLVEVNFKDGELISGKCGNGKKLNEEELYRASVSFVEAFEICKHIQ